MVTTSAKVTGWLLAAALVATAEPGAAQRPEAPLSGIWIADAAGELRRVEPAAGGLLRAPSPPPAPASMVVVLAVETFARSASGATAAAGLAVERVVRAVSGFGVSAREVTREPAVVRPRFEYRLLAAAWEKPRLLGYDVAQVVSVRTSNADRVGLLIDLAIQAGAPRVLDVAAEPPAR